MSLLIGDKLVVSIHYKLTNAEGKVLDSSEGTDPLNYLHGAGNIIPGLENALVGKVKGDSLEVTIQPEEAYGLPVPELVQKVPMEMFQGVEKIDIGMVFQTQTPEGQAMMVTVTAIEGDEVTIDGNHPLAGETLTFNVTVDDIRDATEEEVQHGHVHEPGHSH